MKNFLKNVWEAKWEILFGLFVIALLLQVFGVVDFMGWIGLTNPRPTL